MRAAGHGARDEHAHLPSRVAVAVAAAVVPAVAFLVAVAVRGEAVAGHRGRDGGAGNVLAFCRHTWAQRRREWWAREGGVVKAPWKFHEAPPGFGEITAWIIVSGPVSLEASERSEVYWNSRPPQMFDLPFIGHLYKKSSIHYAARKYMLMISQNCHQSTEKLEQILKCFKLNFVN